MIVEFGKIGLEENKKWLKARARIWVSVVCIMEVSIDPPLGLEVLKRLRAANHKSRLVEPFVQDYQRVLEKNRVNEARARQLDKECTELREEAVIKEEKVMEASSKLEKIKATEKLEQEIKKAGGNL